MSIAVLSVCFFVLFTVFSLAATAPCDTTFFCNGSTCSPTASLTFPPGGGTIANRAYVTLPRGAIIGSASVDMVLSGGAIGTPYIWIPNTVSGTVAQIRTKDMSGGVRGSLVKLYTNSDLTAPAVFNSHSRITVVPGGDVWIANRGNGQVIRLKPKPAPAEDYTYGGMVTVGVNCVRAVTFDNKGYLWAGSLGGDDCDRSTLPNNDRLKVFCAKEAGCAGGYAFGAVMAEDINDLGHYGMIGDRYGYVWTVGEGQIRSYSYNAGTISNKDSDSVPGSYGIGMDNDTNLWVANISGGGVYKVTRDANGNIISVSSLFPSGLANNTGVAVDAVGNVWADGWVTNKVSRFNLSGSLQGNYDAGTNPHGAAIDSDNNVWLINYSGGSPPSTSVLNPSGCAAGTGSATVYSSSGTYIGTYTTCGNNPYNYSDMTGFRTTANLFNPGFGPDIPVISTTIAGWQGALITTLATCICDYDGIPASGDECHLNSDNSCTVPLSFSSTIAGTYALQNLNITCTETIPDMLGGLVPCGRVANNTATTYDETQPCTLCHIFIMLQMITTFVVEMGGIIAVFFLIIGGLIYTASAGDQGRAETGKKAMMYALYGLAVILLSWLIVTIVLVALGYINPLGGNWNIVNCAVT